MKYKILSKEDAKEILQKEYDSYKKDVVNYAKYVMGYSKCNDEQKKILDNIPINLLRSFNTSGYSFIISTTNFCSLFNDRYTPQFHYHRS